MDIAWKKNSTAETNNYNDYYIYLYYETWHLRPFSFFKYAWDGKLLSETWQIIHNIV